MSSFPVSSSWPGRLWAVVLLAGMGAGEARAAVAPPPASFVRISEDEGLAHSDVRDIVQDQEGFIWFGLRLGGLTRYDGYELKAYRHDPAHPRSIGNQIIWSLLMDRAGTLWIGTEGGLDRYDRATGSFIHYRQESGRADSLANNVVTCLFEDAKGRLWAGTRDGLCRLDDRERGSFTTFRRPQLLEGSTATNTFRSIMEDPTTGLLWLGASDGLAAFDPATGAFASYLYDSNDAQSLSRNAVNKVLRDERGDFWAFTESGINSFRPTLTGVAAHSVQQPRIAFRRYFQPSGQANPASNFVRDGLIDGRGRMWLATRGGLFLFDRGTEGFTGYRRRAWDPASLSDDLTQTIFEDRAGNLWVGTYAGGVSRLRSDAKPFRTHRTQPDDRRSLSDDRVAGLAFDPAGRLWASTVDGLNCFDGKTWRRFMHEGANPASLPSNDLSAVATAPNGDIWVGSNYDGVYRFDGRAFRRHETSASNLPAPDGWHAFTGGQVNSMLPDANGGVWLGARAYGLDYFRDGKFRHYGAQAPDGRPRPTTNAVFGFFARDGQLWYVTEANGLVNFEPRTQTFTAYNPPMAEPGLTRSLHCVAEGENGVIWVGAADGLLKFDATSRRFVRQYTSEDGLPDPAVMTIVRDRRGHLWLGTANGLGDFDPATEKCRVYEKPDGLPANVFSQRSGALGPDGRVYLGTRSGIVDFAPEELRDNPVPPPVVLTELRWLGPPPADASGRREASIWNLGGTVRVPAGQLGFSVRFSALDFAAPEKNRFQYRLEGWETGWHATSARERSATYTSLPPGRYVFHVRASNADGVWNERGASLALVVEPRGWQTLWFRVVAAVAGAGLIAGGMRWRLRAIRRRTALLEEQVSLRTAQLQREIGVREQAEGALRESHQELERRVQARTAELAQSNASLQAEIAERQNVEAQLRQSQKMEAVGQLAGGIAHDFNNLLTVILGQGELLSEAELTPAERDAAVRDIKAAAQRATNLTRQLLVFSRHQEMNTIAVDLNAVVTGLSKLLRPVIGEHIVLETSLGAGPLGVQVDPGMLEQVLLNMAVNARDAMPRGGRLTITTTQVTIDAERARRSPGATPGAFARLSVSDTGTGIPDAVLPQIFEPFFTTKETGKGTGLGLAISLGIIQQHRGWIEVESRSGEGARFHVHLPLHPLAPEPVAPPAKSPPRATGIGSVLVVEDEAAVRTLVQRLLTRHGYHVIDAESGPEALELWREHREEIAVLLTDIVMPGGIDGHELASRLVAEKPSLVVITMSGYDPKEVAGGGETPRPHLRKPFSASELLTLMASAVAR